MGLRSRTVVTVVTSSLLHVGIGKDFYYKISRRGIQSTTDDNKLSQQQGATIAREGMTEREREDRGREKGERGRAEDGKRRKTVENNLPKIYQKLQNRMG